MADLFISEQGASLHKWADSLVVKKDGKKVHEMGLRHIDTIQVFGNVQISTPLIKRLARFGVELCYFTINGELICQLTPPHAKNILLRQRQFETSLSESFCLGIAKELVSAKIRLGHSLLLSQLKSKQDLFAGQKPDYPHAILTKVQEAENLESLRGLEGSAARKYYSFFGSLFPETLRIQKRTRRPPKDPVNSILSFLYTLVSVKLAARLDGIGYDPYMGYYHKPDYGRQSLALDLMEPLRPALCDRLCLRLFNLKILSEKDFVMHEGGRRLKREAHDAFFTNFNKELRTERRYGKLRTDYAGLAQALERWLRKCIDAQKVEPLSFL